MPNQRIHEDKDVYTARVSKSKTLPIVIDGSVLRRGRDPPALIIYLPDARTLFDATMNLPNHFSFTELRSSSKRLSFMHLSTRTYAFCPYTVPNVSVYACGWSHFGVGSTKARFTELLPLLLKETRSLNVLVRDTQFILILLDSYLSRPASVTPLWSYEFGVHRASKFTRLLSSGQVATNAKAPPTGMSEFISPFYRYAFALGFFGILILSGRKLRTRSGLLPLPPSPHADPIIGHLRFMPTQYEEEVYKEWSDKVGSEFLKSSIHPYDRQSKAVSPRDKTSGTTPLIQNPPISSSTGWGKGAAVSRYNEHWKAQRRYMHDALGKKSVKMFWPLIERDVRFTARKFLDNSSPDDIVSEICRMTGCSILSAVYGYDTTSAEDPLVKIVQVALNGFIQAAAPASKCDFLVNYFPFLEIIPSWFPGAGWKRLAETWRKDKDNMIEIPYNWTKQQIASGTAHPSIVNTLLANLRSKTSGSHGFVTPLEEQEDPLKWFTNISIAHTAGSETSASSILVTILALIRHPEIQAKARQELDGVLGGERLPTLQDRDSLPYMCNIIKETLRWRSVLPTAIPHSCTQEDTYLGYLGRCGMIIPKSNPSLFRAISNNPQVYPEPSRFNPDRFLDPAVPDAPAFGFGRRWVICPGVHFAEATIFMAISTLLAVFDIQPGRDENGNPVIPDARMGPSSLVR
ncbi:O-methylsterigmatocystin oxidoreductase [Rhizoctonia solani AG-1 IA]|uniref:O-methylsterigmatocystin oxidoreductase n=1 Tax=Thanatephorus cucumeris (strain AG1-IA) TaxID=983506 RepID=L8X2Q8_THACA|nr:O-methylsterigmatocystin oxidoreductase [Rhizoctonia solani AG-1 IA]